jgi:hypothetical protein
MSSEKVLIPTTMQVCLEPGLVVSAYSFPDGTHLEEARYVEDSVSVVSVIDPEGNCVETPGADRYFSTRMVGKAVSDFVERTGKYPTLK